MMSSKILIVDDEDGIREQLSRWLNYEGYKTEQAATAKETLALVRKTNFNVALLDLKLPDMDGLALLERLHKEYPDICIIALTAFGKEDSPAKAREAGAFDFFAKPIHFESLIHRIDTAVDQFRTARENYYQREEARRQFQFENIVGKSGAMHRILGMIQKVAATEETILIQGESGTGKELVAGAIHYNSLRRQKPLIIADCGGLSENLAESELFGHEKGAFTGAYARKIGKFERAHQTTLFVDEIGELSPHLQTKFLRFLQEKTFERLGGTEQIEVDVRIIAATNINLPEAVAQGKFRQDLYHRLNRIVINVPPLREHHGDIPLLVKHFIKKYNRRNSKTIKDITKPALELLENYHFPGNVRELENLIASAILLEAGEVIRPETIRTRLIQPMADFQPNYGKLTYREAKSIFEKAYVTQLLDRAGGNISQAARLAKLDRSHLRHKIKILGISATEDTENEKPFQNDIVP
jgi:DNA-binding NtrC family response regulator